MQGLHQLAVAVLVAEQLHVLLEVLGGVDPLRLDPGRGGGVPVGRARVAVAERDRLGLRHGRVGNREHVELADDGVGLLSDRQRLDVLLGRQRCQQGLADELDLTELKPFRWVDGTREAKPDPNHPVGALARMPNAVLVPVR